MLYGDSTTLGDPGEAPPRLSSAFNAAAKNVTVAHAIVKPECGKLTNAAKDGDLVAARLLLQQSADVNERNGNATPLLQAAWYGRIEMATFLLDQGADIEAKGYENKTPLIRAVEDGNTEMVKLLVARGANVNAVDRNGKSVVAYALEHGAKIAAFLFEKGAKGKAAKGSLVNAARDDNMEMARLLIEHGSDVNENNGMATPLLQAAWYGRIEMATFLLDQGADIEAKGYENKTPLIRAVEDGNLAMVKLLLARGANVNAADRDGKTALAYGAGYEQIAAILRRASVRKEMPVVAIASPDLAILVEKAPSVIQEVAPTDALADIIVQKDCDLARDFFNAAFCRQETVTVSSGHLKLALMNDDKPMMRLLIIWGAVASRKDLEAWAGGNKDMQQKYQTVLRQCGLNPVSS